MRVALALIVAACSSRVPEPAAFVIERQPGGSVAELFVEAGPSTGAVVYTTGTTLHVQGPDGLDLAIQNATSAPKGPTCVVAGAHCVPLNRAIEILSREP